MALQWMVTLCAGGGRIGPTEAALLTANLEAALWQTADFTLLQITESTLLQIAKSTLWQTADSGRARAWVRHSITLLPTMDSHAASGLVPAGEAGTCVFVFFWGRKDSQCRPVSQGGERRDAGELSLLFLKRTPMKS